MRISQSKERLADVWSRASNGARVGAAVPLLPRRSAIASAITAAMLSLIAISLLIVACGAVKPPLVPRRLYKDWVALNARSTTRHIMRPRTPAGRQECIALKTELAAAQAAGVPEPVGVAVPRNYAEKKRKR